MKALLRAIAALALLALLVPSLAASAQTDPAALIRQYFEARDRGDVAATMAFYADDAVLEGAGLCSPNRCAGKAAIQREIERQVAAKVQTTITDSQVSGNAVTVRLELRGNAIRAAGVERIVNSVTVEVRGDKFVAFRVRFDTNDPQTATFLNFQRLTGLLRQHYEARNRDDAAAALESFTDDAVFEVATCRPACVGKEAIRRELEGGVAVHRRQTISNLQVSGNTVTFRIESRTDNIRAAGLERIVASATAEFRDGKIAILRSVQDMSDPQTAQFVAWQQARRVQQPTQLPRTGGSPVALFAALGLGALLSALGLALRGARR
ncbi:MAG: nuclear transport factor 2 family protein [Chloroflexi bacterium]|nr:nuclear transport factor 2 family protein [Chloroflexota bacterium]